MYLKLLYQLVRIEAWRMASLWRCPVHQKLPVFTYGNRELHKGFHSLTFGFSLVYQRSILNETIIHIFSYNQI